MGPCRCCYHNGRLSNFITIATSTCETRVTDMRMPNIISFRWLHMHKETRRCRKLNFKATLTLQRCKKASKHRLENRKGSHEREKSLLFWHISLALHSYLDNWYSFETSLERANLYMTIIPLKYCIIYIIGIAYT